MHEKTVRHVALCLFFFPFLRFRKAGSIRSSHSCLMISRKMSAKRRGSTFFFLFLSRKFRSIHKDETQTPFPFSPFLGLGK